MGVMGISSYVKSKNIAKLFVSEEKASSGCKGVKVVINGTALAYEVYRRKFCWFHGGRYVEFVKETIAYVENLQKCNFEIACIIFEGERGSAKRLPSRLKRDGAVFQRIAETIAWIGDGRSVPTRSFHAVSKNRYDIAPETQKLVLPLLCIPLAMEALAEDCKLPVVEADCDVDSLLAMVANSLNAIVMSNDSDMMFFGLRQGYVDLQSIKFEVDGARTFATLLQTSALAAHFGVKPAVLPVVAAALGNDYLPEYKLRAKFYGSSSRIAKTASHPSINLSPAKQATSHLLRLLPHLQKSGTLGAAVSAFVAAVAPKDPQRWERELEATARRYEAPSDKQRARMLADLKSASERLRASSGRRARGPLLYGSHVDVVEHGTFVAPPIFEDPGRASAWQISEPLRGAAYARAGRRTVAEYTRGSSSSSKYVSARGGQGRHVATWRHICGVRSPERTKDRSLLRHAIEYLFERGEIAVEQILAAAVAFHVPPVQHEGSGKVQWLWLHPDNIHFVAKLETVMMSSSMLHGVRLRASRVVDGPTLHVYLKLFQSMPDGGKLSRLLAALCGAHFAGVAQFFDEIEPKRLQRMVGSTKWEF